MKIGFDLDGIFIDSPPFVPHELIEWLYRGPQHNGPSYRFPSTKLEQFIRKLSHFYLFRPATKKNIEVLCQIPKNNSCYLITSRYLFLKAITYKLLKRYSLISPFTEIFLNDQNEQPHLFKEKVIKKLGLDLFVDDDLKLLKYLQKSCPKTKFLWYNQKGGKSFDGVTAISNLEEIRKFI